jgi:tetratricopeptide (TPR) repeat protein/DNA-binding SARP family transcriptional activator
VWGQPPPRGARRTVQTHIASIRGLLRRAGEAGSAQPALARHGRGYLLDIDPDLVDIHRFRRLAAQAGGAMLAVTDRVALWRQAVGLWRGAPLATLAGDWVARTRDTWHSEYRDAVLAWADAEIQTGNPTAAIGPLTDLIDRYPLVEALPAMLMRALYAAGRRTDALDCYAATGRRLDEELAERPGAELKAVYQAILRHEADVPAPLGMPAGVAVPAQLPPDVRGFAGRADQLAQLDTIADTIRGDTAEEGAATAVVISAIAGTAGVGKTALAVHWSHRAAKLFPDGQLYVNLRGFDSGDSMMDPADAVRGFLDALAVPAARIPAGRDAQAALYRTLLAGKRILILLDNARDTTQVRPLLPGAPGCLVLVTSRNRLTSLVATTGAHPLQLDLLTQAEARDLLTKRLGLRRVAAEPDAVGLLIAGCARLPLALAVVAARAATHPHLSLASLAAELDDVRLDALADDDPTTDIRSVFSWSYTALARPAARLFRLLGLHPGPDISTPAAASLAALPRSQVRPLLAELTRANLLVEQTSGRYAFHDLLRAYAGEVAHSIDSEAERRAANHRMLDHYLHTAHTADRLLYPARDPILLTPPQPGTTAEDLADHQGAMAWFAVEHPVLVAAVDHATATGFDTHTWQLAWTLDDFLDRRGHWYDWAAAWRAAVAATRRLADPTAQARAHRHLAFAYLRLGRLDEAHTELRHALDLTAQADDPAGQAHTHLSLARVWTQWGRHGEALDHAAQALDLYRAAGNRRGQAAALNGIGWYHALLGNHRQTLTYCERALTLFEQLGDRDGQATTWDSLGHAHHHLGHHTEAINCYRHTLALYRDLGDRYGEADTLTHLGDTHHTANNSDAARDTWQQALTILDRLDHPDAHTVRTKLHHLNP